MWQFKSEQRRFRIGKVSIGGMLGENPTVMVGSMFYHRQKSVNFQEETGQFNRDEAEKLVKTQEEFSDKTGLPCMLDVVLPSKKWISQVLDFITSVSDAPILIDAPSADVRIAGLDYAKQVGILSNCIYNSFTPESKNIEYEKCKETGIESAVLLAFNMRNMTATGRIEAIRQLLPKAVEGGIRNFLIDTCVLDVPTLGSAFKATYELKNELGHPTGCAAHNAINTWRGLKSKMGLQAVRPCIAVANALTVAAGADWILYGPIEDAPYVFPAVAMVNSAFAQLLIEGGKMPSAAHPIFKTA